MKQKRSFNVLKRPVVILFFALLIVGGFFFWFEYRPSMIRANCSVEAERRAGKDEFIYEVIYRHCLRKQGIEYIEQKE